MKLTYDEIEKNMKSAYFEKSGDNPPDNSFEEKIIEALSSELYGLSCYGDYIIKQAFVQTATGKYLDMLGEMRDCKRKSETRSQGILTFFNSEPPAEDIQIKKGTVCSVKGSPYLQFETTEDTVIAAGESSASAAACSLDCGEKYNVSAGEISVMVNAPVMVESVINHTDFKGGCNNETDSSYRERIIRNYTVPSNGIGKASIENKINKLDYILDCKITDAQSEGMINAVLIIRNGETITNDRMNEIRSCIGFADIIGASLRITRARAVSLKVSADVHIAQAADMEKITSLVKSTVEDILGECKIGKSVSISKITKALLKYDDIEQINIYSNNMVNGEIICPSDSYLKLSDTVVSCYYE